ncbi:hypothetical protein RJT34_31839 [Clitoria ternatea]|uniref:Uncharacterized protein n=1 Tax=Clitoria ternatea TaxID=43366 RepID=A0AAN9I1Q2_CLITE
MCTRLNGVCYRHKWQCSQIYVLSGPFSTMRVREGREREREREQSNRQLSLTVTRSAFRCVLFQINLFQIHTVPFSHQASWGRSEL